MGGKHLTSVGETAGNVRDCGKMKRVIPLEKGSDTHLWPVVVSEKSDSYLARFPSPPAEDGNLDV